MSRYIVSLPWRRVGELALAVSLAVVIFGYWLLPISRLFLPAITESITNVLTFTLLGSITVGLVYLLWWKVGRFKWLLIGVIWTIYITKAHSGIWISLGILVALLWRDEMLRSRLIEQAKDGTRDDAVPKPWFHRDHMEKENPPRLSNDEESTMDRFAERIRKTL